MRSTSSWNRNLVVLADEKAYLMIRVNAIILSVVGGLILTRQRHEGLLLAPLLLLVLSNVLAIIFSLLAIFPRHTPDGGTMVSVTDDETEIFQHLTRDAHHQAVALGRKYRLLDIAYIVFMLGLTVGICVFILAIFIRG